MVNVYECCYKTIIKQYRTILTYEDSVFADVDIEDIHQMRVAVRRIRAAIKVFDPCLDPDAVVLIIEDLKLLAKKLGYVRDLDVSIVSFEEYKTRFPENAGINLLIDYYRKRRERNLKKLFGFLKSKKYSKFKKKLETFIDYLYKESKKELKKGKHTLFYRSFEEIISEMFSFKEINDLKNSEKDLHELRIAIKHLRYTLEFINLKDTQAKAIVKVLKNYQEQLGIINDCNVMRRKITGIIQKQKLGENIPEGIYLFLEHNEQVKNTEKANFELPWDALNIETIKQLYLP